MATALKPTPDVFTSSIPGGTYCDHCGRLRHFHVDDHCVSKPIRSRRPGADETAEAQLARACQLLAGVVQLVPAASFAWPVEQEALDEARAFLAELGR